ncbi:MAG: hypothetical protein E7318_02175 [Clostridiales bacterium]|nr:hypothetical protein [Clostridiales bacterium]
MVMLGCAWTAFAEHPGQTVTVTFVCTGNPQTAISARIGFSFNEDVFEFVSAENISKDILNTAPTSALGKFGLLNMAGLSKGEIGRITLKIKPDAKLGVYNVRPVVDSVYDASRQPVVINVEGEKVAVGHVWDDGRITVEPTCYSEGKMRYLCFFCDETLEEVLPPTVHREGYPVDEVPASCMEAGLRIYPCDICHDVLREEVIPAYGHTEGETVIIQDPTALEDGIQVVQCAICGRTIRTQSIPATGGEYLPGDADADGKIDLSDAVRLLQHVSDRSVKISAKNADVDADGSVDIQDALLLLQYLAGWNVTLK